MELSLQLHQGLLACLTLLIIYVLVTRKSKKNKFKNPPELKGRWPVIGHLHILGEQLLHRTLASTSDELGPIFSLWLGIRKAIVVSNWQVAKECFTKNDKIFSSRPKFLAAKHMAYDHRVLGVAPYGPYWREVRKLAVTHLLSLHRLELLKHVRDSEVNVFIQGLYAQSAHNVTPIEMKETFGDLAMNIMGRMIAGKRYSGADEESKKCQKAVANFSVMVGTLFVSDALPFLGWLDALMGHVGKMKSGAQELDRIFGGWVQEHRQKMLDGRSSDKDDDFIYVMLANMDNGNSSSEQDDASIKATCLSLILGGNDTTVATLTWAVSLLLNNRNVLKKARDEIQTHVGIHRQVVESDIKNLAYLQAIVKETLRLYPAVPLSVPRETTEDCIVAGFHVPKGTRLILNLWKLHRDPDIWRNPSDFIPERFFEKEVNFDFKGRDFEYLPFGSGRRMCPGATFGVQVIQLALARLLHAFELESVSDALVDLTETPGLVFQKLTPLDVVLIPQASAVHYTQLSP